MAKVRRRITWFISYEAIYNKCLSSVNRYEREDVVERIVDQILADPREHVQARQDEIHVILNVGLFIGHLMLFHKDQARRLAQTK